MPMNDAGELLKITQEQSDGTVVLRLIGELDIASAPRLEAAFGAAVPLAGRVTLDLSGVEFIDSSGLRALLAVAGRATEQQRELTIRRPSLEVQRILELSGIDGRLPVVD
jgi:anti-sigma B factor antagonist